MKKLWSLVLALVLMVACFVPAMADTAAEEEYLIQYVRDTTLSGRSDEKAIGKVIKDKFNIVIEFVQFTGDWNDKCAMWLVGADYPEFMRMQSKDMVLAYIEAEALLSFDDYADILPNFFERYGLFADDARSYAADGKLYYYQDGIGGWAPLAGTTEKSNTKLNWIVRSDLLEEAGWPNLLTTTEWLDFFKTAKENHPTSDEGAEMYVNLPFGEAWGLNTFFFNTSEYNLSTHVYGYNFETKSAIDTFKVESHKEIIKFWNDLYQANLLDPEAFTDKADQMAGKANTTQSIAGFYARWLYANINSTLEESGKGQYQYVEMPLLPASLEGVAPETKTEVIYLEDYDRSLISDTSMAPGYGSFVVTKNCVYPERVMALIDYLCTLEGTILSNWGIEGEDYTTDENGIRTPTEDAVSWMGTPAYDERGYNFFVNLGWSVGSSGYAEDGQLGHIQGHPLMEQAAYTAREIEAVESTLKADGKLPWDIFNYQHNDRIADPIMLTKAEAQARDTSWTSVASVDSADVDMSDLDTLILDYTNGQLAKLIFAESDDEFETIWNETVAEREDMGINDIIDHINGRINDYLAAQAE